MPLEFPMINQDYTGSSNKFVYAIAPYACGGPVKDYSTPRETLIFKSAVKLDMHTGQVLETWWLPDDEYLVSEPTFVRKTGGLQEDDGYILCISSTVKDGRRTEEGSFLNVLDAKNLSPQHRIQLPSSVPYGLHSEFVPWAGLNVNTKFYERRGLSPVLISQHLSADLFGSSVHRLHVGTQLDRETQLHPFRARFLLSLDFASWLPQRVGGGRAPAGRAGHGARSSAMLPVGLHRQRPEEIPRDPVALGLEPLAGQRVAGG
eukprot:762852-Hanusia_phi.AAC.5